MCAALVKFALTDHEMRASWKFSNSASSPMPRPFPFTLRLGGIHPLLKLSSRFQLLTPPGLKISSKSTKKCEENRLHSACNSFAFFLKIRHGCWKFQSHEVFSTSTFDSRDSSLHNPRASLWTHFSRQIIIFLGKSVPRF